jgi:ABC-2 type transport system ATP-binding protein
MAEALRAERVSKHYGARKAVADVSFTAEPGERVAIIGPNGAGKTTLLQMLAGALAPTSGTIVTDHHIGWVPQQAAVYGKLSVAENLKLFARLERVDDTDAAVERWLDLTRLRERAREEVGRLSGGNKQRLNIAVGLLSEPPVVLLDEPSSSLDPRQREVLWEFVGGLAERGTTVIYSTHNVGEAEHYADRVLVLADGELLFTGTPTELRGDALHFEAAFVDYLRARGH